MVMGVPTAELQDHGRAEFSFVESQSNIETISVKLDPSNTISPARMKYDAFYGKISRHDNRA